MLLCLKLNGFFDVLPLNASLSTQPITRRFGNCPKNKFSCVIDILPCGIENTLVSTRWIGYLAVPLSKALMCANCTAGFSFTFRTNRAASVMTTFPAPINENASLLRTNLIFISTLFSINRSWKHRSRCGLPNKTHSLLLWTHSWRSTNPLFVSVSSICPAASLYHNAAVR